MGPQAKLLTAPLTLVMMSKSFSIVFTPFSGEC